MYLANPQNCLEEKHLMNSVSRAW